MIVNTYHLHALSLIAKMLSENDYSTSWIDFTDTIGFSFKKSSVPNQGFDKNNW